MATKRISREADTIGCVSAPNTVQSLTQQLHALGIQHGDTLVVHSSLSALGWTCGGAQAVVMALSSAVNAERQCADEHGTLVTPAFTSDNSEPSEWHKPSVPDEWHSIIRATMPAFDPLRSPTRGMGAIAELCRTWPSSIRSNHPHLSFCALGKHAQYITDEHSLALGHGEQSPLARLYDCDAKILLLGVGHHNNSSMHLAELRAPDWTPIQQGASVLSEDGRSSCWVTFDDWAEESDLFPEIGALFEDHHKGQLDVVSIGTVGAATARLMSQRACVDFATEWFTNKRKHRTTAASS
eukprot:TRINITY_DN3877_c0_g1_i1.p1 TRINITY_DN3877_c0_g1~~TRINITY_DN3877_c0_g1_i1.p1  ORF type:complete len:297 (-),score=43.80 TRINITY_DN3877_c0_g1_i1:50-940(-)